MVIVVGKKVIDIVAQEGGRERGKEGGREGGREGLTRNRSSRSAQTFISWKRRRSSGVRAA
jgi:hypothetical protein